MIFEPTPTKPNTIKQSQGYVMNIIANETTCVPAVTLAW